MALTAAERAKKYRDKKKQDSETHKEYLQKERERYHRRKENGEFLISNKSKRAQHYIRRKWRIKQKNRRAKKQLENKGIEFMMANSPTTSPTRNSNRQPAAPIAIHQTTSGTKRKNNNRAKAYRLIDKLKKENSRFRTLYESSRKACQRLRKKHAATKSKSSKISKHKIIKNHQSRNVPKATKNFVKTVYKRTGHSVTWNIDMRRNVKHFLEEDLHSSQAPGKKDTITRNKRKMQKRYLNDTLLNLYKLFVETNPGLKISYVSFCRFRPFWIVHKKIDARETCLCKLHENVKLRAEKLFRLKAITTQDTNELIKQLVCDDRKYECSYGLCNDCKNRTVLTPETYNEELASERVIYQQWVNRATEIHTKEGPKQIQRTSKVEENETIETLLSETNKLLRQRFLKHVFNIKHQYHELKQVRDCLPETEAIIHVDFSENYNGKLAEEIQTMHFGGNRRQISLHTVVVQLKDKTKSYCTVSDNTHHGPGAIWAHMQPILEAVKTENPKVTAIHFVSDGPSTQYRSKNNFFMFHREIIEKHGFERATWNFTESGHGKSSADGVGGTVKRTADRLVAGGKDINDADAFYNNVSKELKNVQLFQVSGTDIERYSGCIPSSIQTVRGTMKLHQIMINSEHRGILKTKLLSCFCLWPRTCRCFMGESEEHHLQQTSTEISSKHIFKHAFESITVKRFLTVRSPYYVFYTVHQNRTLLNVLIYNFQF